MTFGRYLIIGFIFLIGKIAKSSPNDPAGHCALWNAALCKPSYQRSVKNGNKPHLAVDGNRNPNIADGSCVLTNSEHENWWMVDLGDEYLVHTIVITNRLNFPQRFKGVDIDLFLSDPRLDASFPRNTNGIRCKSVWTPPIGTESFDCHSPTYARFVKLVKVNEKNYFNFCELEAMVSKKRGDIDCSRTVSKSYDIVKNSVVENGNVLLNTTASTAMLCAQLCAERGNLCNGCYWTEDTRDCQMLKVDPYDVGQVVNKQGTDFYVESPIHCG